MGIDAGFGCPNRNRGRGSGGCSYCAPGAGRAPYLADAGSLGEQVLAATAFLRRRYEARLFLAYFQAYSSTNAPCDELEAAYDAVLASFPEPGSCRGLVVSTRPDCIDEQKAELLTGYAERGLEVWVELGLQSANDSTLARIRRGHCYADFERARLLLEGRGIRVAAHLIIGLPGELRADYIDTVSRVASLRVEGLKFHDLHVPRGTALAGEYLSGELSLLHPLSFPSILADCIELLPPDCEVMRLCSDSGRAGRLAPARALDKTLLYRAVESELERRGTRQASRWRP